MSAVNERKRYSKDVLWNTIGTFAFTFSLFIIALLLPRWIDTTAAGIFSLALIAGNICMSIGSCNMRVYYASDLHERFSDSDYFWTRVSLTAISFIVCIGYSFAMGYSLSTVGIILLFYVYKCFELITEIHGGVFQRHEKLYVAGYLLTAKGLLCVLVPCLLMFFTHSLFWTVMGMVLVSVLFFFLETLFLKKTTPMKWDIRSFRFGTAAKLFVLCLPLFIVMLSSSLLPSLPRLFFERIYTTAEYGAYSSIATISVIIRTAAISVVLPLVPKFAKAYETKDFKAFYKLSAAVCGFTMILGAIAITLSHFLSEWALGIVFTQEVVQYHYMLEWTLWEGTLSALFGIINVILSAMNDKKGLIIGSLLGAAVCAAVSYPLVQSMYMPGVSISLMIGYGTSILVFLIFIALLIVRKKREPEKEPVSAMSQEGQEN